MPKRVHRNPSLHPLVALFFLCECRRDYSLQRSWSRVRIPPAPPIRGCSSAVEHENVPSPSSQFFYSTMNAFVISGYPPVAARPCRFESGHPSGCGGIGRRTFDHGTARHGLFTFGANAGRAPGRASNQKVRRSRVQAPAIGSPVVAQFSPFYFVASCSFVTNAVGIT